MRQESEVMKILKVDKDKVQVELTKKEVKIIEWGLGWGEHETGSDEIPYSQLQEKFEKIQNLMKD